LALWDEKAQRLVSFEQADMGRFRPSDRRSATSGPPGSIGNKPPILLQDHDGASQPAIMMRVI
jgi:hypothetical protein